MTLGQIPVTAKNRKLESSKPGTGSPVYNSKRKLALFDCGEFPRVGFDATILRCVQ
jgi:hypothetical protein